MAWNVVLPDPAEPGESNHIGDHNVIVDGITEVRTAIDNIGTVSGFTRDDISVSAPIVKANGTGDTVTLSAPTALVASNIKNGTGISVSANGNDVTITNTVTAPDISAKMERTDFVQGSGITLTTGSGRLLTIAATGTPPASTGFPHVINVLNSPYSAAGNGVDDDTAEIQAAIDAGEALGNAVIQLGKIHKISSALTIQSAGITIQGWGHKGTVLVHDSAHTGWMFVVTGAQKSGQWDDVDTTYTLASDLSGVEFKNLMINPGTRAVVHKGIQLLRADNVLLENVTFGYLNGTALQIGGDGSTISALETVHDATFNNVRVIHCGNSTGPVPAMSIIGSNSYSTNDAPKNLTFNNLRFLQNHGPLHIVNSNTTKFISNVQFSNTQLYALSTESIDTVIIEGKVTRVTFNNTTGAGVPASYALFRSKANGSLYPDSLIISNLQLYGMTGSGFIGNKCKDISFHCRPDTTGMSGKIFTLDAYSTSAVDSYKLSLDGVTAPATTMGFVSIDSTVYQNGSVLINGNNRNEPRTLIYTGSAYPTRGTDTGQVHLYIGSVDPKTPTDYGFLVGTDIWVDTSSG
jgi:hypothetical protein